MNSSAQTLSCSIGVMAYNEEQNIGRLLQALIDQRLSNCHIVEIIVVASGCTDRTEAIVKEFTAREARIELVVQEKREGKASAINLFLESGDTLPEPETIERLVTAFQNPEVGMTGAHPVPVNREDHFTGHAVHLLWRLHHRIAMDAPKLGELVAFRNIVKSIPRDTAVDEASIEAIIIGAGHRLAYASDAIVRNKGPENVRDFLKQRRRIAAGHLYLQRQRDYAVSTLSPGHIIGPLLNELRWTPRYLLWSVGTVLLEAAGRALGYYDFVIRKKNPYIWDMATSTKDLKG